MGRRHILLIISVIVLFGFLIFSFKFLFDHREVSMFVKVSDYVGFNVNTSALYFGAISPGGSGFRFLELNSFDKRKVFIVPSGKIKKWVSYSENGFVFEGNKSVKITVNVPKDVEFGEYSGKLKLIFIKTF